MTKYCLVCSQPSLETRPFEKLPGDAIAMEAIHENDIRHTWTEYRSIDDLGKRKDNEPTLINCPKCGKEGRVNSFHEDATRPEFVSYYVWHGSNDNRCYIRDSKQREQVLKTLGRYIHSDPATDWEPIVPRNKTLEECSVCHKPGYAYHTYFQHYNERPIGRIKLHGEDIGPKFRRCYLYGQKTHPKPKPKTDTKPKSKPLDYKQLYENKVKQLREIRDLWRLLNDKLEMI